jgi:hypothetical protein
MVRGQMKIQQMAFMLMAITIFFVLVGMFVIVFQLSSLRRGAEDLSEKNALLLVSKLANSPEFSCGNSFSGAKTNCIDFDKFLIMKAYSSKYSNFWGKTVSNIEIRKIYPEENDIECTEITYPNCNYLKIFDKDLSGTYISNYVTLCRKEGESGTYYDKCELARLFVSYE